MTAGGKGAGMGAVLAAHWSYEPTKDFDGWVCECGARIAERDTEDLDAAMHAHVAAALEAAGYGDTTEVRRYAEMMRDSISVDRAEMADDILAILNGTLTARAEQQAHSGGGGS